MSTMILPPIFLDTASRYRELFHPEQPANETLYHAELPDGTIARGSGDIYKAFNIGAQMTWGIEGIHYLQVKVFDGSTGKYVPSYLYCDDCNYARHICGGCGEDLKHEQGRNCGTGCTE